MFLKGQSFLLRAVTGLPRGAIPHVNFLDSPPLRARGEDSPTLAVVVSATMYHLITGLYCECDHLSPLFRSKEEFWLIHEFFIAEWSRRPQFNVLVLGTSGAGKTALLDKVRAWHTRTSSRALARIAPTVGQNGELAGTKAFARPFFSQPKLTRAFPPVGVQSST